MFYRSRRRRKKGTFMKLTSAERLRTFVLTKEDIELVHAGKARQVNPRKISQRELAERVGVHPSFINHLTAGRSTTCKPEVADHIAEVLGVDVSVLFDEIAPCVTTEFQKSRKSTLAMAG